MNIFLLNTLIQDLKLLPIVLYSIADSGRWRESDPGGYCLTQRRFASLLLNETGQGVSIHVKSPSRLKHIRPELNICIELFSLKLKSLNLYYL